MCWWRELRVVRRTRDWVTKTDLTRYLRCPYAFWLLDQGQITLADLVDESQHQRILEGRAFEEHAVKEIAETSNIPMAVGPDRKQVGRLLCEDIMLFGTPDFDNPTLKLCGRPDGIDVAGGALIPMEVKSHKDIQALDELELAFYWMLLEPHRTRTDVRPVGRLILRRGGHPELVEVAIGPHRLQKVRRFIEQIRKARRQGVRPRICRCPVCSGPRRDEIHQAATQRKDLTLILGIGRDYAPVLEDLGVATWEDLLHSDVQALAASFRARGYPTVTAMEICRWRQHARSYALGHPVTFNDLATSAAADFPMGGSFIALDLEYDSEHDEPGSLIWIVGACVVDGDLQERLILWADSPEDEERNLRALGELVRGHPTLPVVTWAGDGAEVSQLRAAAKRRGIGPDLDSLLERHIDLCAYAQRHVRLPIPRLRLKDVAGYFGIPRLSSVAGGLAARSLHDRYRRTGDLRLRDRLVDYNRDDLDALVGVGQQLAQLIDPAVGVSPPNNTRQDSGGLAGLGT
jgi:predicted RecB family nuclease